MLVNGRLITVIALKFKLLTDCCINKTNVLNVLGLVSCTFFGYLLWSGGVWKWHICWTSRVAFENPNSLLFVSAKAKAKLSCPTSLPWRDIYQGESNVESRRYQITTKKQFSIRTITKTWKLFLYSNIEKAACILRPEMVTNHSSLRMIKYCQLISIIQSLSPSAELVYGSKSIIIALLI